MRKGLSVAIAVALFSGCVPAHKVVVKRRVKIGIVPKFSLHAMERRYRPLWDYLSRETGFVIEPVSGANYEAFLSSIEAVKAEVSFVNGLFYSILTKTRRARAIAVVLGPDGGRTSRGVIISRVDKGIESVSDLRGKTVAVPSRKSVLGYLAQCVLCQEYGLLPDKDFTVVVGRNHDFVAIDVWRGRVDAGFVDEATLEEVAEVVDLGEIRVVARTDPYPNWCVVAFPESDPEVVRRVRVALLALSPYNSEHRAILSRMGVSGFGEPLPGEYAEVRRAMALLQLPY
ncbi:MAG TPA: phosphate/phosphite/phosphonate ABC transporter substrate-binding protein [Armatimonadetes bacterium]|nr:phosphate/phosphite/phosphonate ABC transporter substrate-binding protein [Armatimonadota bacterium]